MVEWLSEDARWEIAAQQARRQGRKPPPKPVKLHSDYGKVQQEAMSTRKFHEECRTGLFDLVGGPFKALEMFRHTFGLLVKSGKMDPAEANARDAVLRRTVREL